MDSLPLSKSLRKLLALIVPAIAFALLPAAYGQAPLKWQGGAEGSWNDDSAWISDTGDVSGWIEGSAAILPGLGGGDFTIDVPSKFTASSIWFQKNPATLQGAGSLLLKVDPGAKPAQALRSDSPLTVDIPVQLDGGLLEHGGQWQTWMTGSKDKLLTINKEISEVQPTGISFAFGTLVLNVPSSFSGGVALNNSIVVLGNDSGAGSGPIVMASQSNTLLAAGGDRTIKNALSTTWISAEVKWTIGGEGNLTVAVPVRFQGKEPACVSIEILDGRTLTFAAGISRVEGRDSVPPGLRLTSPGATLVLEQEIAYTGPTTIEGGRLVMNGTSEAQKSWKLVSPGVLAGTGTIGLQEEEECFLDSGSLSPGGDGSVGTINVHGDLRIGAGFSYLWNFGSAADAGDCLVSLGRLKMEPGTQWKVIVSATAGAALASGTHRWPVITAQGGVPEDAAKSGAVEIDPALASRGYSGHLEAAEGRIDLVLNAN